MEEVDWDCLPDDLQDKIVFTLAIGGVAGSKMAMMLHKRFSQVCKSQAYFKRVNLDYVPRTPWRNPNSSEQEFMLDCYFAGNPDIFFRLLLADIFLYGRYSHVESLLEKIFAGGHPQAKYCSFIVKLMGQTEELRRDGFNEMMEVYNTPGGVHKISWWRWNFCWKMHRIYNGFCCVRMDVPRFCTHHCLPTFEERYSIECNNCKADFETRIYLRRARFEIILFQGFCWNKKASDGVSEDI